MTYTWRDLAELSPLAYERVLSPLRRRGGPRRARLALVTPWPPEQSGVADYSLRLARELARRIDVDIVVRGPIAEYELPLEQGMRLISCRSFPAAARLRQHDRVLYCMGNSSFHEHVYELLRERPGAVVLHDVQLTGFYGWYAGRERPDDPIGRLAERVAEQYGARIPPGELRSAPLSAERRAELGIFMTGAIQRYADRVFVHSRFAQDLLRRDGGVPDRRAPVSLIPFGMPPADEGGVRSTAAQSPLVVHMGVLSEVKGIAALIEAFARFAAGHSGGARLVIAGGADEAGLAHWRALAREQAPSATIEIPGHLSRERYESLLRTADLAVQLRTVSNGEASAAIADCLAAGVPTIVTDLGWMSELPPSSVVHVPPATAPELLAQVMEDLIVDTPRRIALSRAALAHARASSFERVASEYIEALALA